MITPRRPEGHGSADDDPTGVRALLSSLPDPGPMPPALVDRITASLAAEQQRRAAIAAAPAELTDVQQQRPAEPATLPPDPAPHRLAHRRPSRSRTVMVLAGAAATVAAVAVVGANLVDQPTAPTAQTPAVGTLGGDRLHPSGVPGEQLPPWLRDLQDVRIRNSDTAYTTEDFADQASALEDRGRPQLQSLPAPADGLGTASARNGLMQCLSGLGRRLPSDPDRVTADFATFDGRPAVIVLVIDGAKSQAWAIGRDCGPGSAPVLEGPTDPSEP